MTARQLSTLETTECARNHIGPCGKAKFNCWYLYAVIVHMHMLKDNNKTNAVFVFFANVQEEHLAKALEGVCLRGVGQMGALCQQKKS